LRGDYQEWEDRALCKQVGNWAFYAEGDGSNPYSFGKQICAMCFVRDSCLERALKDQEEYGLWGGLTPPERLRLLREIHGADFDWPGAKG